jgi:hypothetical protein
MFGILSFSSSLGVFYDTLQVFVGRGGESQRQSLAEIRWAINFTYLPFAYSHCVHGISRLKKLIA